MLFHQFISTSCIRIKPYISSFIIKKKVFEVGTTTRNSRKIYDRARANMSKTERRWRQEEQKNITASVYPCACKTKYIQMAMMNIVYKLQEKKVLAKSTDSW